MNKKEKKLENKLKPIERRAKELGLQEFYAPNRGKNKYDPNTCKNDRAMARRKKQHLEATKAPHARH